MDHWATISADLPTNGRKVQILSHKGLFFTASRCLPHERTFYPGPSGTPNFDTTGVKIFSHKGWLFPLWNSEYVKATSNPVGGNFWPTGPQVESKIRAHWAQSENIFRWVFSFDPSRCLPLEEGNSFQKCSSFRLSRCLPLERFFSPVPWQLNSRFRHGLDLGSGTLNRYI